MTTEEAKADLNRQIREMQAKFREMSVKVSDNKTKIVVKCLSLVEGTAKRLMTETPLNMAITYWHGKNRDIAHHPSFPGNAPAVDYGTLRRSVTHDVQISGASVRGRVGSTIVDPPYPAYLETGTSRMEARPWLLPAMDINADRIRELLYSVFSVSESSVNIETIE